MTRKKYMRMLISIPDDTYSTFVQNVPNGQRSRYIVNLLNTNLTTKTLSQIPKSAWSKLPKIEEKFTEEEIIKMLKHAWDDVD